MRLGETRQAACKTCGKTVTETLHFTFHGNVWDAEEHAAPCGSACLGGGITYVEAETKAYHGGAYGLCSCKEAS